MYISNPRDSSEDPDYVHPGNAQIQKNAFPNRQIARDEIIAVRIASACVDTTATCRGVNRFCKELTIYM